MEPERLCPSCNAANRAAAAFCGECGEQLTSNCPKCGNVLRSGVKFCDECGTSASTPSTARHGQSAPPSTGSLLNPGDAVGSGRYVVERFIGEGGNKRVYLARDIELSRTAAVGVIKSEGMDEAGLARIHREIQAMGRLSDHPNIVSIYDADEENGLHFLVCQYMEGGSLADELNSSGRLPVGEAIELGRQVADALAHAHSKGVLHRDIKPDNVWLTSTGEAKLGDFGLALIADRTRITTDDTVMGTVAYMAPEVASGGGRSADERSDLYSLGVLLYEMLTGAPPFTGSTQSVILKHISTAPNSLSRQNPDVPRALESVVHQLLEKSPDDRLSSARAVAEKLASFLAVAEGRSGGVESEALLSGSGAMSFGLGITGLVGRNREMSLLREAADTAAAGRGSIVMLAGEPGVGKTRLAEELETYAEIRGIEVLRGQSFEAEGAPSFWPWIQVIRRISDRFPADFQQLLGYGAVYIAQLVPEVGRLVEELPSLPALDPEEARFRVFEAISTVLGRASELRPLLVVLEDLQRADKASLLLLEFLARHLGSSSLMIVGTYRDVELGKGHPLADVLANLAGERNYQRIQLSGLPEDDVAEFISQATKSPASDSLVRIVYRETDGNPFFVQEIVELLIADGRLGPGSDSGVSSEWSLIIPQGIRDTVRQRLDRVSPQAGKVLALASVAGREFSLRTLEGAGEIKGDALIDILEEACAAGLIEENEEHAGSYRFSHALIREALYDEISAARRVGYHRAVGEALEKQHSKSLDKRLTELSFHFGRAVPVAGAGKAVEYGVRAAEQMMDMTAFEGAVAQYRSTLEILEEDGGFTETDHCDLLIALADAERKSGEITASIETSLRACEMAKAMGDGERLSKATLIMAGIAGEFGSLNADFIRCTRDSLELLGPDDSVLRARLMARLLVEQGWADPASVTGTVERARIEKADEIVAMAERVGDDVALAYALYSKINSMVRPKYRHERLTIADRIVEKGELAGDLEIVQLGQACRLLSHLELADIRALDEEIALLEERAEKFRVPLMLFLTQVFLAMRAHLRGDLEVAEWHAQESLRIGQEFSQGNAMLTYGAQMAIIRREQGRASELIPVFEGFIGQQPDIVVWKTALVLPYIETGNLDAAREHYEFFASKDFSNLPDDLNWLVGMTNLAFGASGLGDADGARRIRELLKPYEDFVGNVALGSICTGPVARELAIAARAAGLLEESVAHSQSAIDKCKQLEAPLFEAHVMKELAETYQLRSSDGDRERAIALLTEAETIYRRLGVIHAAEGCQRCLQEFA